MTTQLLIQPRDPLLFRDGRPFTADPGAMAQSLDWPMPSTVAGAVRTLIGNANGFAWQKGGPQLALQIRIRGPLAVVEGKDGECGIYVPAPADVLWFEEGKSSDVLRPRRTLPEGAGCTMPAAGLMPVSVSAKEKPCTRIASWPMESALSFLREGKVPNANECIERFPREARTHVRMNAQTLTADPGGLFSTESLCIPDVTIQRTNTRRTGLLVQVLADYEAPRNCFFPLGGERRAALATDGKFPWPEPPEGWLEKLAKTVSGKKRIKLQLVTPAVFANGWRPGWIGDDLSGTVPGTGIRVRLVSACVPRPIGFSGWDYEKGKPKAASYAAPAGSVYFFEITSGDADADELGKLFLAPLCDESRFSNDGFGLALPGVWDYAGEAQ